MVKKKSGELKNTIIVDGLEIEKCFCCKLVEKKVLKEVREKYHKSDLRKCVHSDFYRWLEDEFYKSRQKLTEVKEVEK